MDAILMVIKLLGGLAMFLYGMEVMGDGLKQGSGTVLKNVLGKLTQNALLGVLTGALVTAVIQSSTATIVLTVGLIGAGIVVLNDLSSILWISTFTGAYIDDATTVGFTLSLNVILIFLSASL